MKLIDEMAKEWALGANCTKAEIAAFKEGFKVATELIKLYVSPKPSRIIDDILAKCESEVLDHPPELKRSAQRQW